jgi:hypothetical protein
VGAAGEAVGGQGKSHDPNTVSTAAALFGPCGRRVGSHGFIFPELCKPVQSWKLKMDALPCSKNSQFFLVARLGNYKQFYQLF